MNSYLFCSVHEKLRDEHLAYQSYVNITKMEQSQFNLVYISGAYLSMAKIHLSRVDDIDETKYGRANLLLFLRCAEKVFFQRIVVPDPLIAGQHEEVINEMINHAVKLLMKTGT